MRTELFDYELPPEYIAQEPVEPRDASRLMVLHRTTGEIEHRIFREIGDYLRSGDLLVANDSRVIPARLRGRKPTGGKVEILLLRPLDDAGQEWECLVRGRGLREGARIVLEPPAGEDGPGPEAQVVAVHPDGARTVRFSEPIWHHLDRLGEIPLPPYITGYRGDPERYQTVYSRRAGSVAAPTAGLHFTPERILALREQGIGWQTVTLHVGLDTFRPITEEEVEQHAIHTEWAELTPEVARAINETSLRGGRIVAVGTTTVRVLEHAATVAQGIDPYDDRACPWQRVAAFQGPVDLYIVPGYRFRAVDALVTNFHLPRSTLLLLVSAFIAQAHPEDLDAGRRILLQAYEVAKQEGYRFFSFGDAMLILD